MKPFRFLLFTLLAALASCSDGIEDVAPAITSYTGLSLAVPQVTVSSASKTMNATPEECTAKDLYLFCFPQEKGEKHIQKLPVYLKDTDHLNGDAYLYNIVLQPGTYHVYVVANMENNSIWMDDNGTQKLFKDLTEEQLQALTEDQLKALTLSYDATTLPKAGNIPMVYASDKDVVVYDGKATEVAANLTFTCAKVVLNVIFDPANTSEAAGKVFNGINWLLTSVKGNNLTSSTNLFTAPATSGDGALSAVDLPAGKFYDDYTYYEANKDVTNADVVTPKGTAVATLTDALTKARKWLYRDTLYLPERSVTKEADATALPVTGKIIGKGGEYTNTYNNISGKNLSTESTENSTDYYKLERGHYYEIVSFVNGLGQYDLPTKVEVKDWTPVQISADFLHTTLWVEKTAASIGSLTKDSVEYTTNALEGITYGCQTQVDSKDVVSIAKSKDGKKLIFSINPAISMETFKAKGATTGTAKVWIQAGNIKKYINVNYNVTPFLTVTPVTEVIYWNDADATERVKVLTFKTNLGGIKFKNVDFTASFNEATGGSHTFGQSTIKVECSSNQVAEGTITVTATSNPQSTTEHTFTVYPYTNGNDDLAKEVKVSVHPPKGYYRIYMRAINDLLNSNENKSNEYQVSWFKAENSNIEKDGNGNAIAEGNNWLDGWNCKNSTSADETKHYVYIYMQKGETSSYSDTENQPIWRFTGTWPGTALTADVYNPGWYYIEETVNQQSAQGINLDKIPNRDTKEYPDQQTITPGKTLIIFNSNHQDYHVHRFPHHLEPGIPLFNYEDNEGWYLYDPTNEPLYRVFDDKPQVEDITYVFYTPSKVSEWYHYYGISVSNKTSGLTDADMYEIKGTPTSTYDRSTGMFKTTLTFKCAHGYYEKAIKLKLEGVTDEPVLFYDMPLEPKNGTITGYYYDGSWHVKPKSGSAKRRR